jgi:hypothetical protein
VNTPKRKATTAEVQAALDALDTGVVSIEEHERKKHLAACKQRRQDLSDDALMLECVFDLFDFDTDERGFLHGLVARSLGKAPEQKILVNEVELGRLLPGDGDVLEGSIKKRVKRMCAQIYGKQRMKGRLAFRREPGKIVFGEGKESDTNKHFAARGEKKLVSAEYFIPLVQGVVDGVAMARPGRERRILRFRRAARAVFDSLPECKPINPPERMTPFLRDADDGKIQVSSREAIESATSGRTKPASATRGTPAPSPSRVPRPLKRFKESAALALRAAKERDARQGDDSSDEFNRQAAVLYVELGRTVAEAQEGGAVETGAAIRQTIALLQAMHDSPEALSSIEASNTTLEAKDIADSETDALRVCTNLDRETQKRQQKPTSGPRRLDRSVQPKRGAGLIPKGFIGSVRDAADISDVISKRGVKLTQAGTQLKSLCPFHEEKTPSFFVSPAKGLYHCQGCKAGGDVFKFVQEMDGVGFRDAVETVARSVGMSLPINDRSPRELQVEYDGQTEYVEDFTL